jgi:hypothetical protein
MAFGKNNANLQGMSLRQKMKQGARKAPKGGGGRSTPYFVNRYEPPTTGPADIIRLIPGEYEAPVVDYDNKDFAFDENGQPITAVYPFYRYINYFHGGKKQGCIGSEGPLGEFKGKGQPCVAADWFWWEWRERQRHSVNGKPAAKPKAMSRSDKWAFTVVVEAPFYQVPQIDKNSGQIRVNPNTKEPYYDWRKGSVRGNDEYAAAGYKKKDGHRQHWSMPYAHFNVLTEYGDSLAKHCRSCGGNNTIEELALVCRSCGEAIVIFDETTLSDDDILRMRDEPVQCPHCKYHGYLDNVIQCTNCDKPEAATLFDFDLEVKRIPGSDDANNKTTTLSILRAIGPRPLNPKFGEDLRKPLDLPKIFAPTPLAQQEKMFGTPPDDSDEPLTRTPVTRTPEPPAEEEEEAPLDEGEYSDYNS